MPHCLLIALAEPFYPEGSPIGHSGLSIICHVHRTKAIANSGIVFS